MENTNNNNFCDDRVGFFITALYFLIELIVASGIVLEIFA